MLHREVCELEKELRLEEVEISRVIKNAKIEGVYINGDDEDMQVDEDKDNTLGITEGLIYIKLTCGSILKVWVSEWGGIEFIKAP